MRHPHVSDAVDETLKALAEGAAERYALVCRAAYEAGQLRQAVLRKVPHGAVFSMPVYTFGQFVVELAKRLGLRPHRQVGEIQRELLVADVLRELRDRGEIPTLATGANMQGVARSLAQAFASWHAAGAAPDAIENALGSDASAMAREALKVWRRYLQMLGAAKRVETGQQLVATLRRLEEMASGAVGASWQAAAAECGHGFARVRVVACPWLSGTEAKLLAALARCGVDVQVDLGYVETFALRWLEQAVSPAKVRGVALAQPESHPRMIAAAGPTREARAVAREIKRLVVCEGVDPSRVCVAAADGERFVPLLLDALDEFGVPAAAPRKQAMKASPLVADCLKLAELIATGERPVDIMPLVASPYLGAGPAVAGGIVRQLKLRGVKMTLEQWRERLKREDGSEAAFEKCVAHLEQAKEAALEAADSHSGPTLARCVEGFRQALRALGLPERIWRQEGGLALRAEEWQAFTALDGALREVAGAQLSAASEASARKLSWRDWEGFRSVLDFVASRRSYPLQRLSSRGVAVMSLQRASSGIDYDVVFVSGVRDNVLPTRPRRPWFLDESDACAIDAAGFSTEPMGNGVEADRHFFACAVRSGARVTYLTWTTCDDEGKAERRSFLVDEHLIALGITPEVEKQLTTVVPASDVMPRSWSSASSHREARLLAMWKGEEIQSDHDFSAMQRRWARRATASLAEAPEAGRFRGIVGGGWVRSRRTWSATSLNMYLSCPFRFFCRYVLGIRVAEDVRDDIDPLDRGTMMHEVMRRFYAEHLGQALDQSKLNHYMDRITAIAAQVVGEAVSLRSSVPSALSKAYYYGLAAKLMRYLEVEIKLSAACGGAWRPAYLEWKFGSEDSPVAVSANKVAVSGIVDRMDKGPDGALVIYDYKTGSVPKLEDIRNASEIQLGLYALVAQTVLGAPVAGAWYVALPDKGRDKGVFRESFKDRLNTGRSRGGMADEEWADFLASVEERIAQCEHGERAGYFPPTPSDKACRSCEYSCVCRANFDAGDAAEE